MTYCSVFGCLNNSKAMPHLSYFNIPYNEERRRTWIVRIGRDDLLSKGIKKIFICSIHFPHSMFKNKRLKPDATPSLYLPETISSGASSSTNTYLEQSEEFNPVIVKTEQILPPTKEASTQVEYITKEKQTQTLKIKHEPLNLLSKGTQTKSDYTNRNTTLINDSISRVCASIQTINSSNRNLQSQSITKKRKYEEILHESDENIKKQTYSAVTNSEVHSTATSTSHSDILRNYLLKADKTTLPQYCSDEAKAVNKNIGNNFINKFQEWQNALQSKYKGNRYEKELKILAMNVYFSSPNTYRLLQNLFTLPSIRTLQKMKMTFKPGVNVDLIKVLSKRLAKTSPSHKYCILCLDELVLKKSLFYDNKYDEVTGLHNIDGIKRQEIASRAAVIMLRGCIENYSQPLCYALLATTKNYADLSNWLDTSIKQLFDTGFVVCAVVSDMNFQNFAKAKGVTEDAPFFYVDRKKIFYLFDVPHLFNGIRNNLLSYDLLYRENKLACWSHLDSFYYRDKGRNIRLAPKLTDKHLNPNRLQRLRVRYAAQALSYTVAAGLSTDIELGHLPPKVMDTVDFIITLNNTFDILNSSTINDPNKYKKAFYGEDYQISYLRNALEILKTIKAINPSTGEDNTEDIKAFSGLRITINGFLQLFEVFKYEGIKFIFTRRLSKAPVENFFSKIRQQGVNYRVPTPILFQQIYSKLVLDSLFKNSSKSDCQDLDRLFLIKDEDMKQFFAKQIPANVLPLAMKTSDYKFTLPSQNTITYVSGYLLKKCSLKHDCPAFEKYIENKQSSIEDDEHFYKVFDKSKDSKNIIVPPQHFVDIINKLENIFVNNYVESVLGDGTGRNLLKTMKKIEIDAPCSCFPNDYLFKLFIRTRIFNELKLNNKHLKRTTVKMPTLLNVRHL